jgi:SOS-response transcriptional repressor LexA
MAEKFAQNVETLDFIKEFYRLKQEQKFASQKEFCENIGYDVTSFNQVLKGLRNIPYKVQASFKNFYGLQVANKSETRYLEVQNVPKGIPLYPVSAKAGQLIGFEDDDYSELPRFEVPGFADCDLLIPVAGDSMYPEYTAGDIIGCKRINASEFIQWGQAHLIDTSQGLVLKYLKPCPDIKDEDCVLLVSHNKDFDPIKINKKSVKKVWIVKGKIKRNLI